ncbi:MAG: M14 family zinc carboxypeptidase [Ignavibacterium sp.]|nr:M14 family zinc carboxypeptidase [Ignavibacterium sp.]MDW8374691.1 M14 family zinc carboxypeptidase [Ignavibacteriales bacterium]
MKKFFLLFLISIFISYAQTQNYKEVKIFIKSYEDIGRLIQMGMEFDHFHLEKDNAIITMISDKDFQILNNSGFNYEILIDNWYEYYNNLPKLSEAEKADFIRQSKEKYNVEGFGFGSMGGFFTLNEIYARLDTMYMLYPNIITQKFQIGSSIENRPIYAVKISDNPNVNENEPQVFINALIHAREPAGMMAVMYYMYYLLENYGTNPEVTYLVNNREIYFVPCINPDGYEYNRSTNPNGGGMWRKNRRNNGGSFGVDLNRNWGYMWGYNNTGSSPTPSSETYRGTAPFSEPENQAIRNLCLEKNFKTALNYHTYSNLLLYPWGYINQPTPDEQIFVEYSTDMVAFNGYQNGRPPAILYEVNGATDDWMYGEQVAKPKIISMTPEVGSSSDGFWPQQSRIFPLAMENLRPNLYITWVAGGYVSIINPSFSQQYFNPGDIVQISVPQIKNKGLSNAENISLVLTSDNPQITIINGSINVGNIASRETINNSQNFSFSIGNIPPDVTVRMMITTYTGSVPMRVDTLRFITGTPVLLFADTTNNINTNWTVTATPSTPRWETTTSTFYSAPNCYTDSPIGNYSNNATVVMTTTNSFNLNGFQNPKLTFYTKYDIEDNWDYGQVEISTNNGNTWIPLAGLYTNPGTGSFQPNGEPLYDGVRNNWVQEQINLSGYTSTQNRLRFELRSDGSVQRDGWYLDDISIYVMGIVPVELSSFTGKVVNGKVNLEWITSSELNNLGFEIQRKILGTDFDWKVVGFVEGKGTTSDRNVYSFIDDPKTNGTIIYRLKQIDIDGSFRILPTVSINFEIPKEFVLEQNYPNPFGKALNTDNLSTKIIWQSPVSGWITLKVYDILGREVATLIDEYREAGRYEVEFAATSEKLNSLPSGIYFYHLKVNENSHESKEIYSAIRKMVLLK